MHSRGMTGFLMLFGALPALAQNEGEALPLITEVLYSVPKGEKGDASKDGTRDATGDEFVEIMNPGSRPLSLTGWSIVDRNPPDAGQFLFVFPEFTLPPGGVVVVFNGLNQTIAGDVGGSERGPEGPHAGFDGAFVYSAGNTSARAGLANDGDWVALRDPQGEVVSCIAWGETDEKPPVSAPLLERTPQTSESSVQRTLASPEATFEAHPTGDGLRFSPGRAPPGATPPKP